MKRTFIALVLAAACLLFIKSGSTEPGLGGSPPGAQVSAQAEPQTAPARSMPSGQKAQTDFGKLPLYFIPNRGQVDTDVAFTVQGKDKTLYFTPGGITLALTKPSPTAEPAGAPRVGGRPSAAGGLKANARPAVTDAERWVVKLDFVGANENIKPVGEAETGAAVSYFRGKPEDWRTGIPTYSRILYSNLWPGIDLAYYGTVDILKYEFIVHPGADPSLIRLAYRGASGVEVNGKGRLEITTPVGGFEDDQPVGYQEINGERVDVGLSYLLEQGSAKEPGQGEEGSVTKPFVYGFKVGDYDRTKPLVLDPAVLVYCGYIGGSSSEGYYGTAMAVDGSGNVYITGDTSSTEATFPVVVGPDLTYSYGAITDGFVAKVNAAGTALVYCGYIGGYNFDYCYSIAVDGSGNAYIAGQTSSTETDAFPVIGGPDLTHNGGTDAFVAKVNAAGTALAYCGYIGGSTTDQGLGIAVDGSGNAYVTGYAASPEATFPISGGPDVTHNGGIYDAFLTKVNAAGTGFAYSGFIGGSGYDYAYRVAVDGSGNAYVTGYTASTEATFPVLGGPDLTYNGGDFDAFVAKVNAAGTTLVYCGYIGGSGRDESVGIGVDSWGNACITGYTPSTEASFPVIGGPDLTYNGGASDAFVAKVNTSGTALVYCGYIGGSATDQSLAMAVDASGNAYVTGYTYSTEATFPVSGGPDLTQNGGTDAFVAKVNASGTVLVYCGYVGGSLDDYGRGIAADASGNAFVGGQTYSRATTFPVTVGPDLTYNGGSNDAFVAKISYYEQPESRHAAGDFDGDGWDEVVMDFGATGAWLWDNSAWIQVATGNAENLAAANLDGNADDELLLDLGAAGLWQWDGGALTQISAVNVDCLAAGDADADGSDEVAADFGAAGLWLRDSGSWTQLSGANLEYLAVADLNGTGGAEIIGDFGPLGLWIRSGSSWTQLSGVNADRFAAGNTDGAGGEELIGDFAATGLWLCGSGSWTMLSGVNADATIAADVDDSGDKEIIGDFAATGLWLWDSGNWAQLSGVNADDLLAADADGDGAEEVLGDFAGLGLWLFDAGGWSQVSGVNPEGLLAADVDGDGAREIIADFGSLGVWKWDAGAWSQISANNPD